MITTWMFPQFIEYIGGQDALKSIDDNYDEENYGSLIAVASFCPFLNIFCAIILIYWYVF